MPDRFEPKELGRTIQTLREQQGWSQQDLAKNSGVSQGQISTMERGEGNPFLTKSLRHLEYQLGFWSQVWHCLGWL
jgi:transcriptional regulator with XRE-family HTH domain